MNASIVREKSEKLEKSLVNHFHAMEQIGNEIGAFEFLGFVAFFNS